MMVKRFVHMLILVLRWVEIENESACLLLRLAVCSGEEFQKELTSSTSSSISMIFRFLEALCVVTALETREVDSQM
jgi:hypothetical protein